MAGVISATKILPVARSPMVPSSQWQAAAQAPPIEKEPGGGCSVIPCFTWLQRLDVRMTYNTRGRRLVG
jgi:hypothetical protein